MAQLHKKFTDSQVKEIIKRYLNNEIERPYIQQILGIGKTRLFPLLKSYQADPTGFSIQYRRQTKTRSIAPAIERNILKETAGASLHRAVTNSSTGKPCCRAFRMSEQKKQIENFPLASQSVDWRMAWLKTTSISL
jgi:hypothetical protein